MVMDMMTSTVASAIQNKKLIDLHTHILPGIDDGSRDARTSLLMLREEYAQGVGMVVLTPHFYAGAWTPAQFLEKREQALQTLRCAMNDEDTGAFPELILGAEVLYFEGMSVSPELRDLCISGTDLLLLEMPYGAWSERMLLEVAGIHEKQGILPIIAHLDRYAGRGYRPKEMLGMDVVIQLNAASVLNRRLSGWTLKLIKSGQAKLVASDCHNMDDRAPMLGKALRKIEKKLGTDTVEDLLETGDNLLLDAKRVKGVKTPL